MQRPPYGALGSSWGRGAGRRSGASFGHVAGNAEVTIHYGATAALRPVRSAYRRQVERIAPPRLLDRDAELAELASFCLQEQRGPYVWWRAGPWAGKSALLSTFVLNPPEPLAAGGVVLVSFFITARLAAQDTREAFTTTLIEQLCTLLGQDLQTNGDEASREAVLLDLLADAAAACRQAGGRLVLVVDGLDEDRGVTTGPGAHSIAAMLPGRPPAGMRLIIAGRANPPIPDDVPDWHPLRDPGIIRLLGDSPHARDLQRLGQSELKRLLTGTRVEQNLLGLLTAARGGLSGPDLRELTGTDLVAVEEILHTVAGRTFTRRLSRWAPDEAPQVYLLGHEELHNAACYYLGGRLVGYRDRLHAWAEDYRAPGDGRPPWPPYTPEYLLAGYPRMLATARDAERLTCLAIDAARHDRMLDLTGGDTAALTEIATCQDLLLDGTQPDLYALAMLSHRRGQLESRNADLPLQLPAVWVALGQPNRAEQLARAIPYPFQRAQALATMAGAVAGAGEHERAEQLARTITHPHWQAWALARVAEAVAAAGGHERARRLAADAEQIAKTITNSTQQAWTLAAVVGALAAAGEKERARRLTERAEQLARTIPEPDLQARALTFVVEAVAAAGERERVEQLARSIITDPYWQARALAAVAGAAAVAGERERARRLAADAEQIVQPITGVEARAQALAAVVGAIAAAGEHERAEQLAQTITHPDSQAQALAELAGALAAVGQQERARRLAERAERLARTITHPGLQAQALAKLAETAAAAGEKENARRLADRAEQFARSSTDLEEQAWALAVVAGAAAVAGEQERARKLADRAEQLAQTSTDPDLQASVLAELVGALAAVGERERAEQITQTIAHLVLQAQALAKLAETAAAAGEKENARRLAGQAEQLAQTITDPDLQAQALAAVMEALAAGGEQERARQLADRAEQLARTITDPDQQMRALAVLAEALAATVGEHERAEQLARTSTDPDLQAQLLAAVAKTVGLPRAGHLLGRAFALGSWLTPLPVLAQLYPHEVIRIADAVYMDKEWRCPADP